MTYKIKLFVYDQINLPQILPQKSNLIDAVLCAEIRKKVGLTSKDIAKHNIVVENDNITWKDTNDKGMNVEFTKEEIELIQKAFKALDDENNVPTDSRFVDFYLKYKDPIPDKSK